MMYRAWRALLVTVAAYTAPLGAQGGTWIEIQHREPLVAGRTTDDVKREALHNAIAEAVRRVSGVRVQGTQFATRAESAGRVVDRYSSAVRLDASGHATDWTIVREEWLTARKGAPGSAITYSLTVRVRVEQETGAADPGFAVQLEPNARSLVVRGSEPTMNDELFARITVTQAANLTLVLFVGDSVYVLAPSAHIHSPTATPRETLEIPSAEMRDAGLRFRASLPAGVSSRAEILTVIATKHPAPINPAAGTGHARDTGMLSLAEFNRWLVAIPAGERAMAQTTLEVTKSR